MSFIVRARVVPNHVHHSGFSTPGRYGSTYYRELVGADCPLGGGDDKTRWYEVVEFWFTSREEAAEAIGVNEIWGEDWDGASPSYAEMGEKILIAHGY